MLQSDLVGVYGAFADFLGSLLVLEPRSVSMGQALLKEWYPFFLSFYNINESPYLPETRWDLPSQLSSDCQGFQRQRYLMRTKSWGGSGVVLLSVH